MTVRNSDSSDTDFQDAAGALADARRWANWLQFDMQHFVAPIVAQTSMSTTDVLLYLISERVAQLAEFGLVLHVTHEHGGEDKLPGDEWKDGI